MARRSRAPARPARREAPPPLTPWARCSRTLRELQVAPELFAAVARADIVWLVLRGTGAPVVAGAVAGLSGAVALATVFRGLLFHVSSADPLVLAPVAGVLGTVALASALAPALRASRLDPAVALRSL